MTRYSPLRAAWCEIHHMQHVCAYAGSVEAPAIDPTVHLTEDGIVAILAAYHALGDLSSIPPAYRTDLRLAVADLSRSLVNFRGDKVAEEILRGRCDRSEPHPLGECAARA